MSAGDYIGAAKGSRAPRGIGGEERSVVPPARRWMRSSAARDRRPRQGGAARWLCAELGLLNYEEAHGLQLRLHTARERRIIKSDILLLLEHPPVFTLGRRGGRENFKVSDVFLREANVPVVHVERGGDITFHGPGQLLGYPILDLRAAGLTVTGYVERLEEVMIRTAAHWGVHAARNPLNHGVWVGDRKLGSLGIAVRRGIAFHGFALNVNMSLEPFGWIEPCGLHGVQMTSIGREIGLRPVAADRIAAAIGSGGHGSGGHSAGAETQRRGDAERVRSPGEMPALAMDEVREQIKYNIEQVFEVDLDLEIPPSCRMSCTGML
jgi:lipoate-protein ligase B